MKLVFLDRDGVLNEMVVDQEHGTIDSPLSPTQVKLRAEAIPALKRLQSAGFELRIATNQPAAAKGKTTKKNLEAVHEHIINTLSQAGIQIAGSHICFHRAEDTCECRKPKPGMLLEGLKKHPGIKAANCWFIGDGLTDIKAGQAAGVKTAFLAAKKSDIFRVLDSEGVNPDIWENSLSSLVDKILGEKS
jgi:D-glycero-D-manno-heptose 1,7-bisphosphate phosphatase